MSAEFWAHFVNFLAVTFINVLLVLGLSYYYKIDGFPRERARIHYAIDSITLILVSFWVMYRYTGHSYLQLNFGEHLEGFAIPFFLYVTPIHLIGWFFMVKLTPPHYQETQILQKEKKIPIAKRSPVLRLWNKLTEKKPAKITTEIQRKFPNAKK